MKKLLDDLKYRGIINAITNEEKLAEAIKKNKAAYIGFDPSAASLHLGNYVMLLMVRRLESYGVKTYAMIGGATGMIGDPSGKSSERNLLDPQTVIHNKNCIKKQIELYATTNILDNYDNFKDMGFLDFLRDVGKMVNINYLLEKDIIKSRLETTGLSYTEFSYNLIQSYDFLTFYQKYDVAIQVGGSDQWGNITAGIEMIRKALGDQNLACGITLNLLTNSEGKKFGKSEKGAIFLDPKLTSAYQMYQFLINQPDSEVVKLLKFLTLLTKSEIDKIEKEHQTNPALRVGQKALADWVVNDIHGSKVLERVKEVSKLLFSGNLNELSIDELKEAMANVPTSVIENKKQMNLVDFLIEIKVADSKRIARELISNNSIMVNGNKVSDLNFMVDKSAGYNQEFTIIKKGKKNYYLAYWK